MTVVSELPVKLENLGGGLIGELGKGAQAILEAVMRGEDIRPNVESITGWLEDRAHEGIDCLEEVLAWVDGKLETALAGCAEDIRAFVTGVFEGLRAIVGEGLAFVEAHPEIFRTLAAMIALVVAPETVAAALPFLRESSSQMPTPGA